MQRHVPFQKAVNFRDLGGYATVGGGTVKWNRLFRCGHMALMTEDDVARLAALDAAAICDFRSAEEQARNPSPSVVRAAIHSLEISPKTGHRFADFARSFGNGEITAADVLEIQRATYREFITGFSDRYATMFRLLEAAAGRPMVIHCTAGKDRTGIGAALILAALGVSEETIREDYLLSNGCTHLHSFVQYLVDQGIAGGDENESNDAKHARMMELFGVHMERLDAALDAMHAQAGSVDGYLRDVLGVTDEKRAKLREWFVA